MLDAYTNAVQRGRWIPKLMGDTRSSREDRVYRTFEPLRRLSAQIRSNAVDSVRGVPVVTGLPGDEVCYAGETLLVVGRAFSRLPGVAPFAAMIRVGKKLTAGCPLQLDEIDALDADLARAENAYRWAKKSDLSSVILTETIAIELED